MAKYAPARDSDGKKPYVRTRREWGRSTDSIVWADSLAEAKRKHGYTRMRYVSITIRRALPEDMPADGGESGGDDGA